MAGRITVIPAKGTAATGIEAAEPGRQYEDEGLSAPLPTPDSGMIPWTSLIS